VLAGRSFRRQSRLPAPPGARLHFGRRSSSLSRRHRDGSWTPDVLPPPRAFPRSPDRGRPARSRPWCGQDGRASPRKSIRMDSHLTLYLNSCCDGKFLRREASGQRYPRCTIRPSPDRLPRCRGYTLPVVPNRVNTRSRSPNVSACETCAIQGSATAARPSKSEPNPSSAARRFNSRTDRASARAEMRR